jgi:ABC-type multidrug transport system ATPase subunit
LELFDNILLIGGGGMIFFGTVPQSMKYFSSIGFPPPEEYTPTDIYLQVSDANFGDNHDFDFEGAFAASKYSSHLSNLLDEVKRTGVTRALKAEADDHGTPDEESGGSGQDWRVVKVRPQQPTDSPEDEYYDGDHATAGIDNFYSLFFRQCWTLLYRDFTLAYRDPSLYYLQFILVCMFGFMVGATFFNLHARINSKMTNISGGLLWIVLMMAYIQVFKVYHLSRSNVRFKHEVTNGTCNILTYWLAELTASAILLTSFIPGTAVAYFMMGLPGDAYPFLLFLFWLTALTTESMLNVITKFSENATVSIVTSQAILVILTVFGGGLFIAWNKCPDYWVWLQEISLFTQASRAAIMGVNDYLTYTCTVNSFGQCIGPLGDIFPCDASPANSESICEVNGRTVVNVMQGTMANESKWIPFGYLVLLFVVFRISLLFLMYVPVERLLYYIQDWYAGISSRGILETQLGLRRVEGQLNAYIELHQGDDELKKRNIPKAIPNVSEKNSNSVARLLSPEFAYQTDVQPLARGYSLEWKNLSVILPGNGKKLINSVSGVALPGRILALMGPSGAGKTTLLNALGNRAPYAKVVGEVTFGKRPFTAADLVYVPQFDEFNQNLTVYEQIEFVGEMKCQDKKEMRRRLGHLLTILGLAGRAKTVCKDLTSGELKRVSVGMGMISNPNVLFLDEPTTGLDSSAAYSIVKYLSELSRATNVVVIMTIHQPAQMVFDMLQDLYLLESGRLAFFGPLQTTRQYFSQLSFDCPLDVNPADFYLDLVNKSPVPEDIKITWTDIYYQSTLSKNVSHVVNVTIQASETAGAPTSPPNSFERFISLAVFFSRYYWRDPGFYWLRIGFLVIISIFMGTLFLQLDTKTENIPQYSGAIFFNIWTALFSAVAATGLLAADRRQAIEQVKNAVLTPSVYCLAQLVISIPFNFTAAVVYQSIFHWLIDINPRGETFIYAILISCGHLMLMEAIMLTVVAVLKNAMLSVTFAMVMLGYLFLFSGFFIPVQDMPASISWVPYITPTRYSFDGYLWQVYSTQVFSVTGFPGAEITGKTLLDNLYGITDVNSWGMFGVLLAWIALFRLTHYYFFYWDVCAYLKTSSPAASV